MDEELAVLAAEASALADIGAALQANLAALLPQPALPGASAGDVAMYPAGPGNTTAGHVIESAEVDEQGFFEVCYARHRESTRRARLIWLDEIAARRSLADFRDDIAVADFLRLRNGAAAPRAAARALASDLLRRLRAVRGAPLKRAKAALRSSRRRRARSGSRAPPAGAAGDAWVALLVDERDNFLASYDRYYASMRAARDAWLIEHAAWARRRELRDDLSCEEADRLARRKGRDQRAAALAESTRLRVTLRGVRKSFSKSVLFALGPPLRGSERFSRLL